MLPVSAMALFCEDIREEKNDIVTLVGILPDTVTILQPAPSDNAEPVTKVLSKLCIYTRINFDPSMSLGTLETWLVMPDGERIPMGSVDPGVIEKARSEAKAKGNALAGIVSRVVIAGFKPSNGTVKVEVKIEGETQLAGALTFNMA